MSVLLALLLAQDTTGARFITSGEERYLCWPDDTAAAVSADSVIRALEFARWCTDTLQARAEELSERLAALTTAADAMADAYSAGLAECDAEVSALSHRLRAARARSLLATLEAALVGAGIGALAALLLLR